MAAEIVAGHQPALSGHDDTVSNMARIARSRRPAGRLEMVTNPHFSFPAAPADAFPVNTLSPTQSPSSQPKKDPMDIVQQPTICQRRAASALPAFSFNPGALDPLSTSTPPRSPSIEMADSPARSVGHRRGGSELIGGDGNSGVPGIISTSPHAHDNFRTSTPAGKKLGVPTGRRGHAHRRSAAMSSHDLSFMLHSAEPGSSNRSGSAPVSPTILSPNARPFTPDQSETRSYSVPGPSVPSPDTLVNPGTPQSRSPSKSLPRARVGFSERVEYIRPLSTISSETESSMSTIRGHSVSNSLSSIVGSTTSSPSVARSNRSSLILSDTDSRPSTAGAILDAPVSNTRQEQDVRSHLKRPSSALSPASPLASPALKSPAHTKRKILRDTDGYDSDSTQMSSLSAAVLAQSGPASASSPSLPINLSPATTTHAEKRSLRNRGVRSPLSVKTWATSLMSRKSKGSSERVKTPLRPTSSPTCNRMTVFSASPTPSFSEFEPFHDFDIDETVTIVSEPTLAPCDRPRQHGTQNWQGRRDPEPLSPAIDLDAALSPLNSSSEQGARAQGRGFSAARRTMHSAGFSGTNLGLQFHRRAESAPELVPFEYSPGQQSASSTMADVFEEDEEEAEREFENSGAASITSIPQDSDRETSPSSIGIHIVEADEHLGDSHRFNRSGVDGHDDADSDDARLAGSISREQTPTPTPKTVHQAAEADSPKRDAIDVVEADEEPRIADAALTPTPSPGRRQVSAKPLKISLPLPPQGILTPDTTSSSFPSPALSLGPHSTDTLRLSTGNSAGADARSFGPNYLVDSGQEVRVSVDDVPSLTSSRSTMTSALQNTFPAFRPRGPTDRPSSLSSVTSVDASQRRKRNSIVSLSKLMSTSFTEKSKLNIEHRPQSEHGLDGLIRPTQTKSRKKRLSKLVQFWKSK